MPQLVWLITGCSSGFGEELVKQILARGDIAVATARNTKKIKHLEAAGASILRLDVDDSQATLNQIVQDAINTHGRIDVLVNNAGYVLSGTWEDLEYQHFLAQFETNVFGPIRTTKAILPHFRQRKAGTLVFFSSMSGWYADGGTSGYAGSKFALEGLVEGLSREIAHLGIRTLLIEPGKFRTQLLSPGNLKNTDSSISDYADVSETKADWFKNMNLQQPGNPEKGVEVIIDAVRGEGSAKGKQVPLRLPLGVDAYEVIGKECLDTLQILKDWQTTIKSTDF